MKKEWKWHVYIIECLDNTFYTGLTWKPHLRLEQHQAGLGGKYTAKHGVKKLVYYEEHSDYEVARIREKQIKNWSQEKKKRILIRNFSV